MPMTRLEAIARLEEWAAAPMTMSYLAKELREMIAALREPEKDLPDCEGWWWHWNEEYGWLLETIIRKQGGLWSYTCDIAIKPDCWIKGRWVKAQPPPSQPPGPSLDEAAIAAQRLANMNDPKHRHTVSFASSQADGGPGGELPTPADIEWLANDLQAKIDAGTIAASDIQGALGTVSRITVAAISYAESYRTELTTLRAEVERLRSQLSAAAIDCELQGGANG